MNLEVGKKLPANAIVPVIEMQSSRHANEMTLLARLEGVGGVVIADRKDADPASLIETVGSIKKNFSDMWIGVLSRSLDVPTALELFTLGETVDGLLTLNAGNWEAGAAINSDSLNRAAEFFSLTEDYRQSFATVYFGGIALRGEYEFDDPAKLRYFVAEHEQYIDVVTTSGPNKADLEQLDNLRVVRRAVSEDAQIAILTDGELDHPEDYLRCLPLVNYIFVTTGIDLEECPGVLDSMRLRGLMEAYRGEAGDSQTLIAEAQEATL